MKILACTISALALFLAAPHAHADKKPVLQQSQSAEYNVFAGGIHALKSSLVINEYKNKTYDISMTAKTFGLLGKLAPWEGIFSSKGWINSDEYIVQEHISSHIWKGESEAKTYRYNKDKSFVGFGEAHAQEDVVLKQADHDLTHGTSDALTATLNMLSYAAAQNKCEGSVDVFDGKRRFSLVFTPKAEEVLTASAYNAYSGNAIQCTAEVTPKGGAWHKKPRGWLSIQEQGRERGTLPTIWIAQLNDNMPAMPVKVRVKTSYGTLFMHMTSYEAVQDNSVLKTLKLEK